MFFNPICFGMGVMWLQWSAMFWTMKVAYDPRAQWLVSQRYPANVPLTKKRAP